MPFSVHFASLACLLELQFSKAVIAIFVRADGDSGTSWEYGYDVSQYIPIIGVRTDFVFQAKSMVSTLAIAQQK